MTGRSRARTPALEGRDRRRAVRAVGLLALAGALAACGGDERPRLHFTDATKRSGLDFSITSGERPWSQILEVKGAGLALVDWDGDGLSDLFVPNGATLSAPESGPGSRFFLNRGGLRFEDRTEEAGLDFHRWGFGCAAGDVEGDGDEESGGNDRPDEGDTE